MPPYLSQLIVPYNTTRNLRSASKHLLEAPNVRLKSYGDRAFSVAAPKYWNDIPLDIKLSGSVDVFISRLKTYLFRLAFNWLFVLVLLLVSYFLFLIVKRYRAFVYTAIQIKLLLLLLYPWLRTLFSFCLGMVIKFQHNNFETMENNGTTTNGSGPSCSNFGWCYPTDKSLSSR